MKLALLILLIPALTHAEGTRKSARIQPVETATPADYWERESYPMNNRWFGNIEYSSDNIDGLSEKVERFMSEQGGKLQNASTYKQPTPQAAQPGQRTRRQLTYRVPAAKAEAVLDKLTKLAPVESFNSSHGNQQPPAETAQDVQGRIDSLNAEMETNHAALENMPIAKSLYKAKLARLKAVREALAAGDEVQINVSVLEAGK
jgi:hypothetical protein